MRLTQSQKEYRKCKQLAIDDIFDSENNPNITQARRNNDGIVCVVFTAERFDDAKGKYVREMFYRGYCFLLDYPRNNDCKAELTIAFSYTTQERYYMGEMFNYPHLWGKYYERLYNVI